MSRTADSRGEISLYSRPQSFLLVISTPNSLAVTAPIESITDSPAWPKLKKSSTMPSPYNCRIDLRDSRYGVEVFKNSIISAWRLDLRIPMELLTEEDFSLSRRRLVLDHNPMPLSFFYKLCWRRLNLPRISEPLSRVL